MLKSVTRLIGHELRLFKVTWFKIWITRGQEAFHVVEDNFVMW